MKKSYFLHLFFIMCFLNLSAKKSYRPVEIKFLEAVKAANQYRQQHIEKIEKVQKQELLKLQQKNNPKSLWTQLKKVQPSAEKPIYVIILANNNKDWYKKNLDSVMTQKYSNFHVLYMLNDSSYDDTNTLITQYIQEKKWDKKITLIHNDQHEHQKRCNLENIYHAVHLCPDNVIVTFCNGNDWYANRDVLTLFNKIYQDKNIWMTYGNFSNSSRKPGLSGPCQKIPKNTVSKRSFREYRWVTGQPQTFYAWLFKRIKKQDLMVNGEFFKTPGAQERAIMYPLLEMAGHRFQFIPDNLYVHNSEADNAGITRTVVPDLQKYYSSIILQRKKYAFLKPGEIAHGI